MAGSGGASCSRDRAPSHDRTALPDHRAVADNGPHRRAVPGSVEPLARREPGPLCRRGQVRVLHRDERGTACPAEGRPLRRPAAPLRAVTVQKLDRALKDCAKSKTARKGFPRFKRRDDRSDAFQFVGREARCEEGRIKLPALGWLRVRGLRIPEGARLVQVTVRQDRGGWALALQIEGTAPVYLAPSLPAVGIDVGLTELVALITGRKIEPP